MSVSARLARRFAAEMARIGLSPESNVAVALSAGPDSMALTTLTAWWTRAAEPLTAEIAEALHSVAPADLVNPTPETAPQFLWPVHQLRQQLDLPVISSDKHDSPATQGMDRPPPQQSYFKVRLLPNPPRQQPAAERPLPAAASSPPGSVRDRAGGGASAAAGSLDGPSAAGTAGDLQNRQVVAAVCVDHGLRAESVWEAAVGAQHARSLGMTALQAEVRWATTGRPTMRLARLARQEALQAAAHQLGSNVMLLGHHAGDQAETVLMRATRASGIAGLAGIMSAVWDLSPKGGVGQAPVLNLRPLLNMHKHELEALLREQGIRWVRDPTNIDEDYLRNHLRALMQHLPAPALPAQVVGQASSAWGRPPVHLHNTAPNAAATAPNGAQGGAARQAVHCLQQHQQHQRRQQQHAYPAGFGPGGRRSERQPRSRVIQAVRGHSSGEAVAVADPAGAAALQQQRSLHADLLRVCGACSELDDVLRQQAGALLLGGRPVVHVSLPDAGGDPSDPSKSTYVEHDAQIIQLGREQRKLWPPAALVAVVTTPKRMALVLDLPILYSAPDNIVRQALRPLFQVINTADFSPRLDTIHKFMRLTQGGLATRNFGVGKYFVRRIRHSYHELVEIRRFDGELLMAPHSTTQS